LGVGTVGRPLLRPGGGGHVVGGLEGRLDVWGEVKAALLLTDLPRLAGGAVPADLFAAWSWPRELLLLFEW
jgi:hypothetical protein